MKVNQLRALVRSYNKTDDKGIHRMPDGALVSKAKHADLLRYLEQLRWDEYVVVVVTLDKKGNDEAAAASRTMRQDTMKFEAKRSRAAMVRAIWRKRGTWGRYKVKDMQIEEKEREAGGGRRAA